jgi:hypothetical protein
MLPGLLELLRFVELYLKHATERHWVGTTTGLRGEDGGEVCTSKEISDSIEIMITVAAAHSHPLQN